MSLPPSINSKAYKKWEKDQESKKEITDVIIRRFNSKYSNGRKELIAIFPGLYGTKLGLMQSYMHVGQHAECNYWHVVNNSKIVKDLEQQDVKDLMAKLKSIGYNLKVVRRMTEKHRDEREAGRQTYLKSIKTSNS